MALSLRVNFSWTLVGNVVYAACRWGWLILIAKVGGVEPVGQFALGLAIVEPVNVLADLQLRSVLATDVKRESVFADYLRLRLITATLAVAVVGAITFVVGYRRETALVIMAVALWKAADSVCDVFYGLLQQNERMDCIAKSLMIKGTLSLAALGTIMYLANDLFWGLLGLVAVWILVLMGYDVPNAAFVMKAEAGRRDVAAQAESNETTLLRSRWEMVRLFRLASFALPLGVTLMLIMLGQNIPRYFVERYAGEAQLGIFAAMAYLMLIGNTVVTALGHTASPRLAKYYAARNASAFRTLLLKLVVIGGMLGAAGIVAALIAGREILELFYRPEFAQHVDVFGWIMLAAGIGYMGSFLGYGITATRQFKRFPVPYLIVTLISCGSSAILIPVFGLTGAAWTLCIISVANLAVPIFILSTTESLR